MHTGTGFPIEANHVVLSVWHLLRIDVQPGLRFAGKDVFAGMEPLRILIRVVIEYGQFPSVIPACCPSGFIFKAVTIGSAGSSLCGFPGDIQAVGAGWIGIAER